MYWSKAENIFPFNCGSHQSEEQLLALHFMQNYVIRFWVSSLAYRELQNHFHPHKSEKVIAQIEKLLSFLGLPKKLCHNQRLPLISRESVAIDTQSPIREMEWRTGISGPGQGNGNLSCPGSLLEALNKQVRKFELCLIGVESLALWEKLLLMFG